MRLIEVKLFGVTVAKLLSVEKLLPTPPDRQAFAFLRQMDVQLNVFGNVPDDAAIRRIKDLAWKYRRWMPTHLAPKLPPHDPVVREMEGRDHG